MVLKKMLFASSYDTAILRGLLSSRLFIVIVSTPFSNFALTLCSLTVDGSVKLRRNRVYRRSFNSQSPFFSFSGVSRRSPEIVRV